MADVAIILRADPDVHPHPSGKRSLCAGVLSLERLFMSDLCQIRLTVVGAFRRIRQLRVAEPPYIDTR